MTAAQGAIDVLLGLGVATTLVSALAVVTRRDLYDRLHYLAPAAAIGGGCVTAAVLVDKHLSQAGIKALIIFFVLLFSNSVLSHATARAARIRQFGRWIEDAAEVRGNLAADTAGLNSRPVVDSSYE